MTRVVPDTNVIISAIFWAGKPYRVIVNGLKGDYELVISPEIVDEVLTKLRVKFHFPEDKIEEQANIMMSLFHVVTPATKLDVVRDKTDNKILECALDGRADFVVTGDPDLLELKEFEGIKITTADEFLRLLS